MSRILHVSADTRSRHSGRVFFYSGYALGVALCLTLNTGCLSRMNPSRPSAPLRDINAVLADHDQELLAIPGVVGVYVGLLPDEKTPCLKVMQARKDSHLERRIPRMLEGHPVIPEVTGEIRPMQ
ncbi:MAG: hypothetical protein ABIV39_14570 [Verrucomicrobiota bacterium]